MDVESIHRIIVGSGSEYLITIDVAYPKIAKSIDSISQKRIIVQSAARSLPLIKNSDEGRVQFSALMADMLYLAVANEQL